MKLAVLGASGGCGQQLVKQARERGHTVTAVVRSTSWQPPAGVSVARGDLTDERFLSGALEGVEAVLSALGLRLTSLAPWARPEVPDFLSRSTPALVAAMKAAKVTKVLAISAGGVGDSYPLVPGFFRMMIRTTALRHSYAELEVMESVLLRSGLDVSICRPTGLTDGPRTDEAQVVTALRRRATISRADVAAWMLKQLERPDCPTRTPMITVTGAA